MTGTERADRMSAAEVLRLKLRISELGAALRARQETFNDMLEQLQVREEEAVHLAGEHAARTAAEASAQRLRFLAEASALLSSSLDFETTLASVARLAVPVMADLSAVDIVDDAGALRRLSVHHQDARKADLVRILEERFPAHANAAAGAPKVLRTGRPDAVLDVPDALVDELARNEDHLRLLRELQIRSYIVVPLVVQDEIFGTMTVAYAESNRRYTEEDVALIEDLGRRAATAIQNARLVRGLEQAQRRLQDQAQELEAQAEELQAATEELELNAADLREANVALRAKTEEAEQAREAAEAANALKSEFLATMSHELRTPLNAIAGYGELLEMGIHGTLTDAQLEAISRIRRNQQRLLSMINDVLNFARLEAGKVPMDIQDVSLAGTFADLEAAMEPQMRLKGLHYQFEQCGPDLRVRADREKMEQVILNLLSNATKFTPSAGRVRMYCDADATSVYIHVSDTGRGIPPEKLHQIFEPFVQVDPKRTLETEGIGLGLAISRDLARAMGGELRVTSTVGEGSTFTLQLPRVT